VAEKRGISEETVRTYCHRTAGTIEAAKARSFWEKRKRENAKRRAEFAKEQHQKHRGKGTK
jgi:hypothetical protein